MAKYPSSGGTECQNIANAEDKLVEMAVTATNDEVEAEGEQ
jgi:hypothetical protein